MAIVKSPPFPSATRRHTQRPNKMRQYLRPPRRSSKRLVRPQGHAVWTDENTQTTPTNVGETAGLRDAMSCLRMMVLIFRVTIVR